MFSWIWVGLIGHPWIWDNQLLEWNILLLDREQAIILLHLGQLSKMCPYGVYPKVHHTSESCSTSNRNCSIDRLIAMKKS
jgi:hypothetical protein